MGDKIISTQRVGINGDVVQIILGEGAELPSSLPLVEKIFRSCFKKNDVQVIVNMANIELPPTKFIALLIEVTNQARRLGGDVKLINVSNSVRNNLVTFSAISYLSIEDSEEYAIFDFDEKISSVPLNIAKDNKSKKIAIESVKTKKKKKELSKSDNLFLSEDRDSDKIRVQSTVEKLYNICDFVTELAGRAGFDNKEVGKIKVTVYEACLNVVEHAYFSNPDNWIEVSVNYDKEKFIIIIHDWGEGFQFNPDKEYNVEQAVKDRKTGGFGLHIIRRSVDDIKYETNPKSGNRLILTKYLKSKDVMIR